MTTQNKGVAIVSEAVCEAIVGRPEAFTAVENIFAAMAKMMRTTFPLSAKPLAMPMPCTDLNPVSTGPVRYWGLNPADTGPAMQPTA